MRFVIRPLSGKLIDRPIGPPGRQLEMYLPPNVEWEQLNYGQGEGQVEIEACEFGIYRNTECLDIVMHSGELPASKVFEYIRRIAIWNCGEESFEIVLQGRLNAEETLVR